MDVYKIGISIALANGVSGALAVIQKDVLKLNKTVDAAVAKMGRLKLAIASVAGIALGGSMLKGLADLSRHGEKYIHQLEQMKVAGMQAAEIQASIRAANRVSSDVLTTTPTENLKTISELRMALASADVRADGKANPADATREAIEHLSVFQKITGVLASRLSKDGKTFDGSGQAFEMAKAAEILGLSQDPKKFDALLEGWTQAIIASGGKLQGSDFFGTVKYLRGAGMGMSLEFLTRILPSLMQEMKSGRGSGQGGGAGNPLASMFAEVVGGQMNRKTVRALEGLGLLSPKDVMFDHGTVTLRPGAVKGSGVDSENPFAWVHDYLEPSLRAHTNYLDKDKDGKYLHEGELRSILAALFPNRTAQQITGMMLFQQSRIAGDRGLNEAAWRIDPAYRELVRNDPDLVRKAMSEQWERLMTDLGKAIAPATTELIYQLATGLRYLSEVVERHPVATKWLLTAAAGFAAVVTVLGTIGLAAAGIGAIAGGGTLLAFSTILIGLGSALGYFSSKYGLWSGSLPSVGGSDLRGWQGAMRIEGLLARGEIREGLMAWRQVLQRGAHEWGVILGRGAHRARDLLAQYLPLWGEILHRGAIVWGDAIVRGAQIWGDGILRGARIWSTLILRGAARVADAVKRGEPIFEDLLVRFFSAWGQVLMRGAARWGAILMRGGEVWGAILARGATVWWGLISRGFDNLVSLVSRGLARVAGAAAGWAGDLVRSAKTDLLNAWVGIGEGLHTLIQHLVQWLLSLPGKLISALTGLGGASSSGPAPGGIPVPGQTSAGVPPPRTGGDLGTQGNPLRVHVENQISGHEIATGVSEHQANRLNRPSTGITGGDLSMDLTPAFHGILGP
jgi:hypothetical protein